MGKGVEIGLLNIQQREFETTNATNFTVGRLRKNVFANSDVGVMIANKEVQDSSHYNRAYGADANFRFGPLYERQHVHREDFITGHHIKGYGGTVRRFLYQRRVEFPRLLHVRARKLQRRDGLRPAERHSKVRRLLRVYLAAGALAQNDSQQSIRIRQIDYVLDPSGRLDTKYVDYHLPINFQNSTFIEIGKNPSYEYLAKAYLIAPAKGISIPAGGYRYSEYFVLLRTDTGRKISGNGRWAGGPFYTGYKHSYQAWRDLPAQQQIDGGVQLHAQQHQPAGRPLQDEPVEHAHQLRLRQRRCF